MTRSYSPRDLVQLPTLSAEDAYALASQLLTQADAVGAPASLTELLEDLASSRDVLRAQLVARRTAPGADPKAALEADRRVDAVWSALRDWLGGWGKLGAAAPRASEVAELNSFLFGEGLSFLSLRFEAQWTASETRVSALRTRRNDELVRALGGGAFLDALFVAHDAYGGALGITRSAPAPTEAKVREARDALAGVVREYVVAVLGTVRRSRPASAERADQLLRPLSEWESRRAVGGELEPAPAPTPPVDPPTEG